MTPTGRRSASDPGVSCGSRSPGRSTVRRCPSERSRTPGWSSCPVRCSTSRLRPSDRSRWCCAAGRGWTQPRRPRGSTKPRTAPRCASRAVVASVSWCRCPGRALRPPPSSSSASPRWCPARPAPGREGRTPRRRPLGRRPVHRRHRPWRGSREAPSQAARPPSAPRPTRSPRTPWSPHRPAVTTPRARSRIPSRPSAGRSHWLRTGGPSYSGRARTTRRCRSRPPSG